MTAVVGDKPPPATSVLARYGDPEEVANVITFLLGPESKWVTGELYRVDGGEFC
jgi:NAD(P)-dependent dehydrogenase (short-subunit alcohol dehydrogenase family)